MKVRDTAIEKETEFWDTAVMIPGIPLAQKCGDTVRPARMVQDAGEKMGVDDGKARVSWRCRNGHKLGYVARNGRGNVQLFVYRESDDEESGTIAIIRGNCEVICSVCGERRVWKESHEGH